jgi:hypothetical protein
MDRGRLGTKTRALAEPEDVSVAFEEVSVGSHSRLPTTVGGPKWGQAGGDAEGLLFLLAAVEAGRTGRRSEADLPLLSAECRLPGSPSELDEAWDERLDMRKPSSRGQIEVVPSGRKVPCGHDNTGGFGWVRDLAAGVTWGA